MKEEERRRRVFSLLQTEKKKKRHFPIPTPLVCKGETRKKKLGNLSA